MPTDLPKPAAICASGSCQHRWTRPLSARRLFSLSLGIEVVQLAMNAGRVVGVDDVLFNTTGALVGVLVAGASARCAGKGRALRSSEWPLIR
ncbi:VanZ family protein [Streptomyces sp. NPDC056480]|uniref:VanZ family protein n=1 Tax=Streptomyces sp. NPDC056480 TaxID=3345833 RepID=UPI0036C4EBC8